MGNRKVADDFELVLLARAVQLGLQRVTRRLQIRNPLSDWHSYVGGVGLRSLPSFERFGALCAVLAGIASFLYAVAFIIVSRFAPGFGQSLAAMLLMLGGLLTTGTQVAVYDRLRETNASFALWALLLGVVGAMGAAIHGGYDLANVINPVSSVPASVNALPSQIDPRGLLTFGITGVSLVIIAFLIRSGGSLSGGLGTLGYVQAILLLVLYLGRLILLSATHPVIVISAVLSGFLTGPAWYIWLGLVLWRGKR